MNRSFYNGVIGTKTYQYGLDTLADNISNVSTIGYKGKTAEFATIFSQTLAETGFSPTFDQVGLGSTVNATTLDMTPGTLIDADNDFDMAIAGDGWFAVKRNGETFYTRKGAFNIDAGEYLVNDDSAYLLGVSGNIFTPDPDNPGEYTAKLNESVPLTSNAQTDKIFLPSKATMPPKMTSEVRLAGNLDPVPKTELTKVDIPEADYESRIDEANQTFSANGTIQAGDTIKNPQPGDTVLVTVTNADGVSETFNATLDENLAWEIADADIAKLDPANAGPLEVKAQIVTEQESAQTPHFRVPIVTPDGETGMLSLEMEQKLPAPELGSEWNATAQVLQYLEPYDPDKTYDPEKYYVDEVSNKVYTILDTQEGVLTFDENGALTQNTIPQLDNGGTPLTLNLGTPYNADIPNSGYDGLTAMGDKPTALTDTETNGYQKGELKGYSVDQNGTVFANFTNGKSSAVATIPVYHFINDQGLSSEGHALFLPTANSGKPYLYTDKEGNVVQGANVVSHKLENSNVMLSTALTEMIVMQKAFDSNAKSITTSDQMIQTAINMKK